MTEEVTLTAVDTWSQTTSSEFQVTIDPEVPDISSMSLVYNTGVSANNGTTDPTLGGSISLGDFQDPIAVQFDLNGNAVVDATTSVDADGNFTYFPAGLTAGTYNFAARTEDEVTGVTGSWTSISLTLEADTGPGITLSLSNSVSDGGTTTNPTITGYLTGDYSLADQEVEFDLNGDGEVNDTVDTDNGGNFTFDPFGLSDGPVTIEARGVVWDSVEQEFVTGAWTTISFTLAAPAGPSLTLSLANATSSSPTGWSTSDPTLEGSISWSDNQDQLIEFEFNGDNTVDGTTYTNGNGSFTYQPIGLNPGQVVVLARAAGWDNTLNQYDYGSWSPLTFTLIPSVTNGADEPATSAAAANNNSFGWSQHPKLGRAGCRNRGNQCGSWWLGRPGWHQRCRTFGVGIGTYDLNWNRKAPPSTGPASSTIKAAPHCRRRIFPALPCRLAPRPCRRPAASAKLLTSRRITAPMRPPAT